MVATIATVSTRNRNHGDRNVRRKTRWPRRKIDRYPRRDRAAIRCDDDASAAHLYE